MSKKINIIFEGLINDYEAVKKFQELLVLHGSKTVLVVDTLDTADMKLDISEINGTVDLYKEVVRVIKAAKGVAKYEKTRKRLYRQTGKNILLATSRKDVN